MECMAESDTLIDKKGLASCCMCDVSPYNFI